MPFIETFRANTITFPIAFVRSDSSPLNVSGYGIFFAAAYNYSTPPFSYTGYTGSDANAQTGVVFITLSSGDTNQCAGDYPANGWAISPSGTAYTSPTVDMLRVLPSVLPYEG